MRIEETTVMPWSPGGQASFEQQHAMAVDRLRRSTTYLVVCLDIDADDKVDATMIAGTCETTEHGAMLVNMLLDNLEKLVANLTVKPDEGEPEQPDDA